MGEIVPEEQFLPLSTIFYYLMLDFYVKTGIRYFLRDKRLFEITEVEITRVDCILGTSETYNSEQDSHSRISIENIFKSLRKEKIIRIPFSPLPFE